MFYFLQEMTLGYSEGKRWPDSTGNYEKLLISHCLARGALSLVGGPASTRRCLQAVSVATSQNAPLGPLQHSVHSRGSHVFSR